MLHWIKNWMLLRLSVHVVTWHVTSGTVGSSGGLLAPPAWGHDPGLQRRGLGLLVEVVLDYLICSFPAMIKPITLHGSHQQTQWTLLKSPSGGTDCQRPSLRAPHTAACGRIPHDYVDVDSFQGSLSSTMRHYTGNPPLLSDLPHCHWLSLCLHICFTY